MIDHETHPLVTTTPKCLIFGNDRQKKKIVSCMQEQGLLDKAGIKRGNWRRQPLVSKSSVYMIYDKTIGCKVADRLSLNWMVLAWVWIGVWL